MIYERKEFIKEQPDNEKYPAMQIETLTSLDGEATRYIGRVTMAVQTPMGYSNLPISFEIDAQTIEDAFGQFEACAEVEIEKAKVELQAQLQEMRHKAQNRIVTPGEMGGMGGGMPGAGAGGGSGLIV